MNERELATVLAALRNWQRQWPSKELLDISTDSGAVEPLNLVEIDELCENLNADPYTNDQSAIQAARSFYKHDGHGLGDDIEIYDDAKTDDSPEDGIWVESYVWVLKDALAADTSNQPRSGSPSVPGLE